jgi:prepilin-type N-terminal cleavage/methylation domain-containing protein/prepilin-type processing-associated H-X9-DG protein
MSNRKAFTLVELLVVVAIIALLLAMLLPALNKAREVAKGVVCGMHLRQISMAAKFYGEDWQDVIPFGIYYYKDWSAWLMPYAGISEEQVNTAELQDKRPPGIFACPSGDKLIPHLFDTADYGQNGHINPHSMEIGDPSKLNNGKPWRFQEVELPAQKHHVADADTRTIRNTWGSWAVIAERHNDFANMLYFDGHMEPIQAVNVIDWPHLNDVYWFPQ